MSLNPSSAHKIPSFFWRLSLCWSSRNFSVTLYRSCSRFIHHLTCFSVSAVVKGSTTNSIRFLASAILTESRNSCTDSDHSPKGLLLEHFIAVIPHIHSYSRNLSGAFGLGLCLLVRFSHYVSWPFLWIVQPFWSGQPHAGQLVCIATSTPYVCWIVVGVNMSPFNEIFGTDLANSVCHELLVGSSSLDPMECNSTVAPPMH